MGIPAAQVLERGRQCRGWARRCRGADRAPARARAGPPGADAGAARGARVEARGRVAVRGDRPADGRNGGLAEDADAPGVRPAAGRIGGAPMTREFHPLVKRLLDGELTLGDLPLELRTEGEEALRLLAALDSTPVTLSPLLDAPVRAPARPRAGSPTTARQAFR